VLQDNPRLLKAITENASVSLFIMDERQHCVFMNPAAERLTGYSFDEVRGRPLHDVIHHTHPDGRHYPLQDCPIDRAFPERNRMQGQEVFIHKEGHFYEVAFTASPIRADDGEPIGTIIEVQDVTEQNRQQRSAKAEAELLEVLNKTATLIGGELNLERLLQGVTDSATQLTGAQFGAFFYQGTDSQGEALTLYTLSGAPREAFERFGHPRPTPVFEPTFRGGAAVRIDDVQKDPRYGQWGPHHGMPKGHLPVRSYLAVTVMSRQGQVIGGLFFGHPQPGMFSERSERLATGIAAQAAVAIDNARLYADAQRLGQERTQLLESERAARAEAERASTLKDEFLATLSHELRTPLSAILGWAHILRRKLGNDPSVSQGIDVIERSTRVQTQLIEDLLDMSRITSGKLRLDTQPLAPVTFVQAAIDSVRPAAETVGVGISLELDDTVSAVSGDQSRLQQVIWNLLTNAIKFSPIRSEIQVRISGCDDKVNIEVIDQGVGISPDFLPHVFERFRQADGSTTRKYGGLGLGLSIVRHLVDLHGGEIEAFSEGEGTGAKFVVRLPALSMNPHTGGATAPPPTDVELDGLSIMIVDDEPDVLELLRRILSEAGAKVVPMRSSQEAIESFSHVQPQLLISDIGMPGMDGYELIRRLRREHQGAGLAAVALTAFARPEDRKRALDAGFDLYLPKPVEPHDLLANVRRLATTRGPVC
jgi:PAS domain S-box-containing protein